MLNQKKVSIANAAAKVIATSPTGVTTEFIPINSNTRTSYLRIATTNPHNFFVGSLVTVTGLQNNWSGATSPVYFIAPIIAKPIVRIDDPYSFCIDIPYADAASLPYTSFAAFNGNTSVGHVYSYATARLVNGQLNSVDIKYAQP
jgi:hypothetical protein